jgi:hypothetical protein
MLEEYCVYIDNFRVKNNYSCENTLLPLLLLTHAHADHHGRSIKKFRNVVCSGPTAFILDILDKIYQPIIVEPGKTYQHSNDVVFTVFDTIHSPGSIGFYFHPPINVLHVGDSRIDTILTQTITNIISTSPRYNGENIIINKDRDNLKHRNVFKLYPSVQTSRENLFNLWEQNGAAKLVVAMHSDSLCLLLNGIFTPVPLSEDEQVTTVRDSVKRSMSMLPKTDRQILVCGRLPRDNNFAFEHPNYIFVEPSLLWYVNDVIPRDPYLITKDKRGVWRMFASSHASRNETEILVNVVTNVENVN